MKKIVVVVISLILLMGINGCSSSKAWSEKDFVFYENSKVVLRPTAVDNKYRIFLDDAGANAQTYRKVKIGDDALTALAKYDLSDSTYNIYNDKSSWPDEEIMAEYLAKAPTGADLVKYLDELSAKNFYTQFYIEIYKQDGKLCTSSGLKDDGREKQQKRKYLISFAVSKNLKIDGVMIVSDYHSALATYHGVIPEGEEYDWIRDLEN